jgi:hypothetical protein
MIHMLFTTNGVMTAQPMAAFEFSPDDWTEMLAPYSFLRSELLEAIDADYSIHVSII